MKLRHFAVESSRSRNVLSMRNFLICYFFPFVSDDGAVVDTGCAEDYSSLIVLSAV
jgi:hypothetical protein